VMAAELTETTRLFARGVAAIDPATGHPPSRAGRTARTSPPARPAAAAPTHRGR
jgi:hypothetical protein